MPLGVRVQKDLYDLNDMRFRKGSLSCVNFSTWQRFMYFCLSLQASKPINFLGSHQLYVMIFYIVKGVFVFFGTISSSSPRAILSTFFSHFLFPLLPPIVLLTLCSSSSLNFLHHFLLFTGLYIPAALLKFLSLTLLRCFSQHCF